MAIKKLKIENLPETGEYKPAGTLGKHRLYVLEKKTKYAIVKDINGVVLKIKNGALYNCGTVLFGLDEQEARKKLWQQWWYFEKESIVKAWEYNNDKYNANYAKGGDKFANSQGAKQILQAMKELDEKYDAHKQMDTPTVYKSCAEFLRVESPEAEPKYFDFAISGDGWKFINP